MSSIKKPTKTKTMTNAKNMAVTPKKMPSKNVIKKQPAAAKIPSGKMKMGGSKKGC